MTQPNMDDLLRASKQPFVPSTTTSAALDTLVSESAAPARRGRTRHARRALWAIPASALALGALTGGGVLFAQYFDPHVRVPIEYVTESGVEVGCTLAIREHDENAEARAWLNSDVWDGVGQRIHDYAIANPWSPEGGERSQDEIDAISFNGAMNVVLEEVWATGPLADDAHLAAVDNCTGQLR